MKSNYLAITELALDVILTNRYIGEDGLPSVQGGSNIISKYSEDKTTVMYVCGSEQPSDFFAIINIQEFEKLKGPKDLAYSRIARVLKAASNPPIHLPRSWSEFHHDNLLSFFAEPESHDSRRWIVEIDSGNKCAKFLLLTDSSNQIRLEDYRESSLISQRQNLDNFVHETQSITNTEDSRKETFVKEFDLST